MKAVAAGRLAFAIAWLLVAGAARAQIDPFYLDLERDAQAALARGDGALAAKLYRVACFGMLDETDRLAACTVRLMRAQAVAKDDEGFQASFLRLATVEERFQGLSRSGISLEEKRELARLAAARLSGAQLSQVPVLAELAAAPPEGAAAERAAPAAKPKEPRRRKKADAPPAAAVAPPAPSLDRSPAAEESAPIDAAVAADEVAPNRPAAPEAPPAPTAPTPAERERLDAARARANERPERALVEAELAAVRAIADRYPGDVAAARLAGDLAYLLGLWSVCAEYQERAGEPGIDETLARFNMAICLVETGQTERARSLLAPVAGRLKRSPFVDGYLSRILGSAPVP